MSKVFEALSKEHDREGFDCGVSELNLFLRQYARRQQDSGISRTFVLTHSPADSPKPILGFFSLVASRVYTTQLSQAHAKRLPNNVPCVLLARLAVAKKEQGKGYGKALLAEAIIRTLQVSTELGVAGLFVDAKDEMAATFYRKFGFEPSPDNPLELFQPLKSLQKLI